MLTSAVNNSITLVVLLSKLPVLSMFRTLLYLSQINREKVVLRP